MTSPMTPRERAKAERTDALLHEAARLFASRGYSGVSLEEIGAAVGVSGPAVYRHFAGKQALLGTILVKVSQELVAGGEAVAEVCADAEERMRELIAFHVRFALGNADVIRVQDRDLAHLSQEDGAEVRRLQRTYIEGWMHSLAALLPSDADERRLRVQACFGLINSTPHSTRPSARSQASTRAVLAGMAYDALVAPVPEG